MKAITLHEHTNPSASVVLEATAGLRTNLEWFDRVELKHFGEDGVGFMMERNRETFLADQEVRSGTFQNWAMDEIVWAAFAYEE